MAEIKPEEVSAILREQLSGAKTSTELEEIGTVLTVGDGVARIYGLTKAQAGELVTFENGLRAMVLNLEEDNVGAVLLGESKGIKEGDTVKRTGLIASIKIGEGVLGRVVSLARTPHKLLYQKHLSVWFVGTFYLCRSRFGENIRARPA